MADLRVVGLGLRPGHLTAETEAVLRECREVLYVEGWELPEIEKLAGGGPAGPGYRELREVG